MSDKFYALVKEIEGIDSSMGIYPAAMKGYNDERDYEQRDGYKNGWNACVMHYGTAVSEAVDRAAEGLEDDLHMLMASGMGWMRDGCLYLNMNDTWCWASAMSEKVEPEELPEVARLFRAWGFAGLLYWMSEKNDQMTSQFKDINRFIEYVRFEEGWRSQEPDSTKRAFNDPPKLKGWLRKLFERNGGRDGIS